MRNALHQGTLWECLVPTLLGIKHPSHFHLFKHQCLTSIWTFLFYIILVLMNKKKIKILQKIKSLLTSGVINEGRGDVFVNGPFKLVLQAEIFSWCFRFLFFSQFGPGKISPAGAAGHHFHCKMWKMCNKRYKCDTFSLHFITWLIFTSLVNK